MLLILIFLLLDCGSTLLYLLNLLLLRSILLICIIRCAIGYLISLLLHAVGLLARCRLLRLLALLVGIGIAAEFLVPLDELIQALIVHFVVHYKYDDNILLIEVAFD